MEGRPRVPPRTPQRPQEVRPERHRAPVWAFFVWADEALATSGDATQQPVLALEGPSSGKGAHILGAEITNASDVAYQDAVDTGNLAPGPRKGSRDTLLGYMRGGDVLRGWSFIR